MEFKAYQLHGGGYKIFAPLQPCNSDGALDPKLAKALIDNHAWDDYREERYKVNNGIAEIVFFIGRPFTSADVEKAIEKAQEDFCKLMDKAFYERAIIRAIEQSEKAAKAKGEYGEERITLMVDENGE